MAPGYTHEENAHDTDSEMSRAKSVSATLIVCLMALGNVAGPCGGSGNWTAFGSFGGTLGGTLGSQGPNPTPVPKFIKRGPVYGPGDLIEIVVVPAPPTQAPDPIKPGPAIPAPTQVPPPSGGQI